MGPRAEFRLLLLAFLSAASTIPAGAAGYSFVSTPGQLPKSARPLHYDVALAPDIARLSTKGSEQIDIAVSRRIPAIILNALNMTVTAATVDGAAATVTQSAADQTVTVRPAQEIAAGRHSVTLSFTGKIIQAPQGLYELTYPTGHADGTDRMLATMMEPADARRLFPCFDEPAFKATFILSATLPRDFTAVSNMPVASETPAGPGFKTVRFATTPPMSTYLVALVAGHLDMLTDHIDGVTIRVVTTHGKSRMGRIAIDDLKRLLPLYNDYFGIPYPLPKLDLIALPGGFTGGMENWGAITFNEARLLFDPVNPSQDDRETAAGYINHEVAHQWFGDLVTMAWWNDLWLNEGFASWMDGKATNELYPQWEFGLFALGDMSDAMDMDARSTTHPIEADVKTPDQAMQSFDAITYLKGQSVIRMVESTLGQTAFRDGVRRYLRSHSHSNTTTTDLWNALSAASGYPVADFAGAFTQRPGVPLVTARIVHSEGQSRIVLHQAKFSLDGPSRDATPWPIPVAYRLAGSPAKQIFWLRKREGSFEVPAGETIILNPEGTGYYHVAYAPELDARAAAAAPHLSPAGQITLVNDHWALLQSGLTTARSFLGLAGSLSGSRDANVWGSMLDHLKSIDRLERMTSEQPRYRTWAGAILRTALNRIGTEPRPGESSPTSALREQLLDALAGLDDPATTQWAQKSFDAATAPPSTMAPDLRPIALRAVAHNADTATYDRLHDLARTASSLSERELYYQTMAAAVDPKLASRTLDILLSDEVPASIVPDVIHSVIFDGDHAELVWDWIKAHSADVIAKLNAINAGRIFETAAGALDDPRRIQEVEATAHSLPAAYRPALKEAEDRIRSTAALRARLTPQVEEFLNAQK